MDREIKFRVWDTEKKKYYKHILWLYEIVVGMIPKSWIDRYGDLEWLQYTGFKINDVEVFEGDIVKSNKNVFARIRFHNEHGRWFAHFPNFYTTGKDVPKWFSKNMSWVIERCEIVGNIYENAELLSGSLHFNRINNK